MTILLLACSTSFWIPLKYAHEAVFTFMVFFYFVYALHLSAFLSSTLPHVKATLTFLHTHTHTRGMEPEIIINHWSSVHVLCSQFKSLVLMRGNGSNQGNNPIPKLTMLSILECWRKKKTLHYSIQRRCSKLHSNLSAWWLLTLFIPNPEKVLYQCRNLHSHPMCPSFTCNLLLSACAS